ncbi:MAG: AAA family ATPase [Candidatus Eremiobacteraeota bacterium]|nr:AAA family ATPase [Candidatus Eremiobacteraeota bacterium]
MDIGRTKAITGRMQVSKSPSKATEKQNKALASLTDDIVTIKGESKSDAQGAAKVAVKDSSLTDSAKTVPKESVNAQAKTGRTEPPPKTISVIEEKPVEKTAHAGVKEAEPKKQYDENFIPGDSAKLIDTKSTVENLTKLARSVRMKENVLLVGPTGAGKTAIVKYLSHLTQTGLRRINLNDMTDITEIIGGYKPNDQGRPEWQDGIVVDAMKKGQWLLLDEVNLADPAILERMNSLLDDDRYLVLTEKDNEMVKSHDNFRVFATMNPSSYAGRKKLSAAMMNRLHKIWMDGLEPQEMVEIMKLKTDLGDKTLLQMAMFHQTIADMSEHRQIGKRDGPYPFTLRDTLKWIKRVNHFREKEKNTKIGKLIWREASHVYKDRFIKDSDKAIVEDTLRLTFAEKNKPADDVKPSITENGDTVTIGAVDLDVNPKGGQFVPGKKAKLVNVGSTVTVLEKMAKCTKFDEPVLMVGPTASGKTAMVKYMANLTNNNLRRYNLSMQTDTTEFIGGYKPTGVPGEYVWSDGILVDAMKKGDWVVLDEINLAEPAILERINSLLDGDRSLVLTEKSNERIEATPNFRVFATMNPATSEYGGRKELSLAMRNRFSEMWVPGVTEADEQKEIVTVFMKKVPDGEKIAPKMVDFQNKLAEKVKNKEIAAKQREGFIYTLRNIGRWADFMKEFHEESGVEEAFLDGADHIYASEIADKKDRETVRKLAREIWSGKEEVEESKDENKTE